ncbi:MAG: HAMP domain-containing histidine kinase [Actinomycetota bacterium]|nr:HAMP domain-containing histidine kinase [Actinomycetota bacterium]
MADLALVVAIALASALVVGGAGWLLLRRSRPRSLGMTMAGVVGCSVLTVVAGMAGTAQAMFLSPHDLGVVLAVCAAGGAVALVLGLLLARKVVDEAGAVRDAAQAMATGDRLMLSSTPLTTELAAVARELEATSRQWAESRERAAMSEESRRELVAWISHDLRTPLAGLQAMAEALEDGVAEDPARYHRQIRVEVDRLSAMVGDLFQLSGLQAGSSALSIDRVALDDLLSDTLASADALARAGGVRLEGQATDAIVLGADARGLSRVLGNLVTNAIRHTPDAGRVHVEVHRSGDEAVISVEDACGGIAAAELGRVFEMAWRGNQARTPGDGRAGLGLAIVRGIVTAHQGSVSVANTADGCRFEVRLPISDLPVTPAVRTP